MAYLQLQESASYQVHEMYEVEVQDHEDHTFCGIMFDVAVRGDLLPLEYLEITHIWVRGNLGHLTVWVTFPSHAERFDDSRHWKKVFDGTKQPSMQALVPLQLQEPIRLVPNSETSRAGVYVHSTLDDDSAIVYDNQRHADVSHEDRFIRVYPGLAHISPRAFDSTGWWGWAWRPHREFVGKLSHGVRYLLWKPELGIHERFPTSFRDSAMELIRCAWHRESPLSAVPQEVPYYVLNMCPWNWFSDEIEQPTQGDNQDDEEEEAEISSFGRMAGTSGIGWANQLLYRRLLESHAQQSRLRQLRARGESGNDHHLVSDSDNDDDDDDEDYDNEDDDDEDEDEEGNQMQDGGDDNYNMGSSDDEEEDQSRSRRRSSRFATGASARCSSNIM